MTTFFADNFPTPQQQNLRLAQILTANFAVTQITKIDRIALPPPPIPPGPQAGWLIEHN